MLCNASKVKGYAIAASDGMLGTASDLLFDDASWLVRWLVVDTSNWLTGRKVLLPTSVLGHLDPKTEQFAEYPIPTRGAIPRFIDLDKYGRIWFGEWWTGKIGVMDPDGSATMTTASR